MSRKDAPEACSADARCVSDASAAHRECLPGAAGDDHSFRDVDECVAGLAR